MRGYIMTNNGLFVLVGLFLLIGITACNSTSPAPTATATPALSSTPSSTSTATALPPTATASATPDPRCQFPGLPSSRVIIDSDEDSYEWQFAEAAEVDMDAELLAEGIDSLSKFPALYSVLIIRDERIVVERYFNGQSKSSSHEIASASKGIMSVLAGLALWEGYFNSTAQTLGEVLPSAFKDAASERSLLTLDNLLTMQTGFAWEPMIVSGKSEKGAVSLAKILATRGSEGSPSGFLYNTGAPHLMSAAITEASGMSTCDFAYRYLFDPMGITVDWWNQDSEGYFTGGWNMYLTPRELAKFGLLYLQDGMWQGVQVLPQDWVRDSLAYHVSAGEGSDTYYSYWWWLSSMWNYDVYSMRGGGGQMVYLIPGLDLVFVTTSDATYQGRPNQFDSLEFLWQYVIPAAMSY